MRRCSHCEGPVEPGRDVCGGCRSKLKSEALRVQRHRYFGVAGNAAPPGGHVMISRGPYSGLVSQFGPPMHSQPVASFRSASHIAGTMGIFASGGVIPPQEPVRRQEPFSMEHPDADRAPDLIEPVLAWRGWNITPDGHLVAAATDGIWDAGVNHAVCHGGPNHTDVPAVGCNCGFYGWHDTSNVSHGVIWGAIKCWGEVIVHDVGVRAEYAEIVVLIEKEHINAELLARVVDRYKVPIVKTRQEAEAVAEGEGILTPPELRPDKRNSLADAAAQITKMAQSTGMTPAEVAKAIQAAHSGAQPASIAFAQLSASMQQLGKGVATQLAGFEQALATLQRPKTPTAFKFIGALVLSVALSLAFVPLKQAIGLPQWSGFLYGCVASYVAFFSPLVDYGWRAVLWVRNEGFISVTLLALCIVACWSVAAGLVLIAFVALRALGV